MRAGDTVFLGNGCTEEEKSRGAIFGRECIEEQTGQEDERLWNGDSQDSRVPDI